MSKKARQNTFCVPLEIPGWTWIGNSGQDTKDAAIERYRTICNHKSEMQAVVFERMNGRIKFAIYEKLKT